MEVSPTMCRKLFAATSWLTFFSSTSSDMTKLPPALAAVKSNHESGAV